MIASLFGGGPAAQATGWRSPAVWSSMVHASSHGPLLVEVTGAPWDAAHVAATLDDQVIGQRVRVTADPAGAPAPAFRVVLAFTLAAEGRLTVRAEFKDGDQVLAASEGWAAGIAGPGERKFRQLMGQVVRALFGDPP
jgi:hypothetical protein